MAIAASRGDVVIVALPGDLGKPRPALIIQSDLLPNTMSVVLMPITSTIRPSVLRVILEPTSTNGLQLVSQVMTDRVTTANRAKIGAVIGHLEEKQLNEVGARLSLLLGLIA